MNKTWIEKYRLLEKYYKEHGNIDIPIKYEIDGVKLGVWLHTQRQAYKGLGGWKITEERTERLNKLGMNWGKSKNTLSWDEHYEILEKYYVLHNNIDLNKNYQIDEINLGSWLNTQRQAYKKMTLSEKKIEKLNKLGMKWSKNINLLDWDTYYKLLEDYKKEYNTTNVPLHYEINNIKLGAWLSRQRFAYRRNKQTTLTPQQIQKLNKLEVDWSPADTQFLNSKIGNMKIYNIILLERLNYVLRDLQMEGINEINSEEDQKELVKELTKRIWR